MGRAGGGGKPGFIFNHELPQDHYASKADPAILIRMGDSEKLHTDNWGRLMALWVDANVALDRKLQGSEEVLLTDPEKATLSARRRMAAQRSSSSRGSSGPWQEIKAMLGSAGAVLGRYAMSTAMQWINPEIKHIEFFDETAVSSTAAFWLLNPIAQGTDFDDRIGNSIRVLAIKYRMRMAMNGSATSTTFRFLLLLDTQSNEAAPGAVDVFIAGPTLVVDQLAPDMIVSPERFAILHDQTLLMDVYHPQHFLTGERDLVHNDVHTLFSGTGATVASISRGALYLAVVSDQATNSAVFRFASTLFYEDN